MMIEFIGQDGACTLRTGGKFGVDTFNLAYAGGGNHNGKLVRLIMNGKFRYYAER